MMAANIAPGTTITTTTETVAANIPAFPVQAALQGQGVVIEGAVIVATGAGVTAIQVKLRVGQNNTTTAQVDATEPVAAGASGTFSASFEFVDLTYADLASGYTITVTQVGATGNGTVSQVDWDVDLATP